MNEVRLTYCIRFARLLWWSWRVCAVLPTEFLVMREVMMLCLGTGGVVAWVFAI